MKKINYLFSALCIVSVTIVSCTKENVIDATDNSSVIASASIDLVNELDVQTGTQVSYDNSTSRKTGKSLTASCAVVTMQTQTTTFPKTYYVDFANGCTTNGITKKGKLKITFSNYVTETGSTMTVERENYYVNGNKVEGTIVYKNTTTTIPQWTRTVTNGKFTDTNGAVYTNSGTHTTKQTAGVSTFTLEDNVYELSNGNHIVTNQNGSKITLTIVEPLIKKFSCDYVSKGQLKVEGTLFNGVIDYGNGDCDNLGTYTQNGIANPFTM